jgi:hypothetical protein
MVRLKPCPSFSDAHSLGNAGWAGGTNADVLGCAIFGIGQCTDGRGIRTSESDQRRGRKRGRENLYRGASGVDPRVKSVPLASRLLRHLLVTGVHENAKHQTGSCSTCSPASHQARERRSPHKTPSAYLRRFPYWPFSLKFFAHPSCVVRALLLLV